MPKGQPGNNINLINALRVWNCELWAVDVDAYKFKKTPTMMHDPPGLSTNA